MTRRTLTSFRHAGRGLRWALTSQPNLRLHLAAAVIVLAAAILVGFTTVELAVVVLCAAVVIAAELFNTALEVLIDHAWPERHPIIGRAKDVTAAAVLFAAIGAALAGVLLFGRHLFHLV